MVLGGGRRSKVCGFRWDGADLEVPYTDLETGEPRLGAVLPVKRVLIQLGGKLVEEATAKTKTGWCSPTTCPRNSNGWQPRLAYHPLRQADLAAAGQVAALVRKAGGTS